MVSKFKSQLGDVYITTEHFERKKRGEWENILEQYPDEKILDKAHFNDITGLKLETGSVHPCIKVQLNNNDWHFLFFQVNDPVEKCWTRLRYMWQAYLQNHGAEFVRN